MEDPQDRSKDQRALAAAFDAFNELSARLETSYGTLEQRVAGLTAELAAAQDARRRQAEDRLRLARRLKELLEALPGGVIVLDAANKVTQANPAAIELLGEPLIGRPWPEITGRAFRALDAGGEILLNSGRRLALSRRRLASEGGEIILLTDTTERHALEELLERHERLSSLGEMAAALAHQIRTPLASALLYATNAAAPDLEDGVRRGLIERVVERLQDLDHLIADMLLFARGGGRPERGVRVAALLAGVESCMGPQLAASQSVAVIAPEEDLCLDGNEQALRGALINLVANALTAAGDDARVTLSAARTGLEALEIAVEDNGPGVASDRREDVFKPFFSTRAGGTGLGLAVVRAVAEAHGGVARVESPAAGGARFVLRLPLARSTASEAAA